jgi:hypothetical protein
MVEVRYTIVLCNSLDGRRYTIVLYQLDGCTAAAVCCSGQSGTRWSCQRNVFCGDDLPCVHEVLILASSQSIQQ